MDDLTIKAAVFQLDCRPFEMDENIGKFKRFLDTGPEKPDLCVLPELFNTGYDLPAIRARISYDHPSIERLSGIAAEYQTYIAAGILEYENQLRYNSLFVFDKQGAVVSKYRKINLFSNTGETSLFQRGLKPATVEIEGFRFGLLICYDIRFPELTRRYIDLGCHGLIVSAAFPITRRDHWQTLLKARAIENQMFIAASNMTGTEFAGSSCIISPSGKMISQTDDDSECSIEGTLSMKDLLESQLSIPCRNDRETLLQISSNWE